MTGVKYITFIWKFKEKFYFILYILFIMSTELLACTKIN